MNKIDVVHFSETRAALASNFRGGANLQKATFFSAISGAREHRDELAVA